MKKLLLFIAFVVLLGGGLAWQMMETSGYVLIAFGDYTIDMSLWTLLLILFLAWLVLRTICALIKMFVDPTKRFIRRSAENKQIRMRENTAKGLLQFMEGRWDLAKRNLKRASKNSDMPLVNYLAAANSAYELGQREEANKLLVKAGEVAPDSKLAIGLVQARMHLKDRQFEEALAVLQRLHKHEPSHPLVLKLHEQAYRGLGDWDSMEKMLTDFRRHKVFDAHQLSEIQRDTFCALMEQHFQTAKRSGSVDDRDNFVKFWQEIPRELQDEQRIFQRYVTGLFELGDHGRAEGLLRKSLKGNWDEELVRIYGIVDSGDAHKQLLVAERWLQERPNDPELLLALGRLSQRNQLWGKAKDYLENALSLKPRPEVYAELAQLMSHMGDSEKSSQYYQQGLALKTA